MSSRLGFHSVDEEFDANCRVDGRLPDWLDGTLIRNGPGSFHTANGEVAHWFDGLAMLRAFEFDGDSVGYRTQFLDTDAYENAQTGSFSGFATGEAGLLERLKYFLFDSPYDNANIIVERVDGEYVALTESPRWIRVDPQSLETLGDVEPESGPTGSTGCAHVKHDPWTGDVLSFEIEFGRNCKYHLIAHESPGERSTIATLPVDEPAYMHSFGATRNYVFLTEFPLVIDPMEFLKPGSATFADTLEWRPDRDLRLRIVDRTTGKEVARPSVDARFGLHHVNAYEPASPDDPTIVFDLETLPDAGQIEAFDLDYLRSGKGEMSAGRLDRFRVDLDGSGAATVERDRRYDGIGLPVSSPAVRMQPYRYVYGQRTERTVSEWPQSIVKVDLETGTETSYDPGAYVNEPIFVPAPEHSRSAEDDGVLLVVLLDEGAERSMLAVLDGQTLEERALVELPQTLPIGFHGRYFPEL